jgi:hypothetical protein
VTLDGYAASHRAVHEMKEVACYLKTLRSELRNISILRSNRILATSSSGPMSCSTSRVALRSFDHPCRPQPRVATENPLSPGQPDVKHATVCRDDSRPSAKNHVELHQSNAIGTRLTRRAAKARAMKRARLADGKFAGNASHSPADGKCLYVACSPLRRKRTLRSSVAEIRIFISSDVNNKINLN